MKNVTTVMAAVLLSLCCAGAFAQTSGQQTPAKPTAAAVNNIERVNINSADVDALASSLHQVGVKKAEAIVAWRNENGNFTSVEQLMEVKGIGESTLEANRDRIDL
ncbi:helix-hairpin-helix domain-containing protein [Aurantivibrio infirmus]